MVYMLQLIWSPKPMLVWACRYWQLPKRPRSDDPFRSTFCSSLRTTNRVSKFDFRVAHYLGGELVSPLVTSGRSFIAGT